MEEIRKNQAEARQREEQWMQQVEARERAMRASAPQMQIIQSNGTPQQMEQLEARERGVQVQPQWWQQIEANNRRWQEWHRREQQAEARRGELQVQPQWWQQIEANNRRWEEWHRREQQAEARILAMPKDHWVIENDTLSGVFDGHAVNMSKKDAQDFWEKINKMSIAQKRDYWASRPTWIRRATLVMLFGREPMAHEVAEPFFLAPHMHSREERSPVVLYGYSCSQRADRSTICMPLK
jgi:hypothetical protein